MEDTKGSLSKTWETGINWADAMDEYEQEMSKSCHTIMTTKKLDPDDEWRIEGLKVINNANLTPLAYKICRETFLWSV